MIILWTAIPKRLVWGAEEIGMLIVMMISSGLIFVAINLFFATYSFLMIDSLPIVWTVFNLSDFARYPLTIYHKGIRMFLTWIIPYGFTAAYFIDKSGYKAFALWTPAAAIISASQLCILEQGT
ncbi:ABC-2 family transporter protein [Bacillus sp. REN3]|uniref:ABC-2 family transporter protein n=1 Tax=Bacillus sp. REN3 TaxID=2802440 RepID=UPI001AEEACC0